MSGSSLTSSRTRPVPLTPLSSPPTTAMYSIFTSPNHPPVPDHLPTLIVTPHGRPSQILCAFAFRRRSAPVRPTDAGEEYAVLTSSSLCRHLPAHRTLLLHSPTIALKLIFLSSFLLPPSTWTLRTLFPTLSASSRRTVTRRTTFSPRRNKATSASPSSSRPTLALPVPARRALRTVAGRGRRTRDVRRVGIWLGISTRVGFRCVFASPFSSFSSFSTEGANSYWSGKRAEPHLQAHSPEP
jgi:hypothetical protein